MSYSISPGTYGRLGVLLGLLSACGADEGPVFTPPDSLGGKTDVVGFRDMGQVTCGGERSGAFSRGDIAQSYAFSGERGTSVTITFAAPLPGGGGIALYDEQTGRRLANRKLNKGVGELRYTPTRDAALVVGVYARSFDGSIRHTVSLTCGCRAGGRSVGTAPELQRPSVTWTWKSSGDRRYDRSRDSSYRLVALAEVGESTLEPQCSRLYYRVEGSDWRSTALSTSSSVGALAPGDKAPLAATIGIDETGGTKTVDYYLVVRDDGGNVVQWPSGGRSNPASFDSIGKRPSLVINEYKSDGSDQQNPDYVEIYNEEPIDIDMAGMFLNACGGSSKRCGAGSDEDNAIAGLSTTIPADGYLVFRFDGQSPRGYSSEAAANFPGQRAYQLHINGTIGKDDSVALYMPDASTVIDAFRPREERGSWKNDHPQRGSYAREKDGDKDWKDQRATLCKSNRSKSNELGTPARCPNYGFITGTKTIDIPRARYVYAPNWQQMEIEAKFEADADIFSELKKKLDGSYVQGYQLKERWGGKEKIFIDLYYDTVGVGEKKTYLTGTIKDSGHALRLRTRFAQSADGRWSKDWAKLQYKSDGKRFKSIWFRTETASDFIPASGRPGRRVVYDAPGPSSRCTLQPIRDAFSVAVEPLKLGELEAALDRDDASFISGGATQALMASLRKVLAALKADHPDLDLDDVHPRYLLVDYRYRVVFLDDAGRDVHEFSFDRMPRDYVVNLGSGQGRDECKLYLQSTKEQHAIELETLWKGGVADKDTQLRQLFRMVALFAELPGLSESTASKGGSMKVESATIDPRDRVSIFVGRNEFADIYAP